MSEITELDDELQNDDGLPNTFLPTAVGGAEKRPVNFVDLLKQDLKNLEEQQHIDIPVQGYERTGLHIRYRRPYSAKELANLSKPHLKTNRGDPEKQNLAVAIDLMLELSQGLYVRHPDTGELITLDPDLSGEAINFSNPALGDILGIPAEENTSPRNVVRRLFDDDEPMLLVHAENLNKWIQNKKFEVGLGE